MVLGCSLVVSLIWPDNECHELQLPGLCALKSSTSWEGNARLARLGQVSLPLDQSGMGNRHGQSYLDPMKLTFSSVFFVLLCF